MSNKHPAHCVSEATHVVTVEDRRPFVVNHQCLCTNFMVPEKSCVLEHVAHRRSRTFESRDLFYRAREACRISIALRRHIESFVLFPRKVTCGFYANVVDAPPGKVYRCFHKKRPSQHGANAPTPSPFFNVDPYMWFLLSANFFTKNAHFCNLCLYAAPGNIELGGSGANHYMPALCAGWAFIMKTPDSKIPCLGIDMPICWSLKSLYSHQLSRLRDCPHWHCYIWSHQPRNLVWKQRSAACPCLIMGPLRDSSRCYTTCTLYEVRVGAASEFNRVYWCRKP